MPVVRTGSAIARTTTNSMPTTGCWPVSPNGTRHWLPGPPLPELHPNQPMNLLIRPEALADRPAVRAIIEAAFRPAEPTPRPVVEAVLNDELWLDPDFAPTLTLVAERDGEVIGQVTSSYGLLIDEQNQRRVIGVGPVSVLPGRQGAGVGSALMRALV